jgi:hypothetical protein
VGNALDYNPMRTPHISDLLSYQCNMTIDMQVWCTLLQEWLRTGSYFIIKNIQSSAIKFTYYGVIIAVGMYPDHIYLAYRDSQYYHNIKFHFSDLDINDPNKSLREIFKPIEDYLNGTVQIYS